VTLTPAQHAALAELFRLALGLDNREDAAHLLDHLHALRVHGEEAPTIMQWLSLLPRARESGATITIRRTFAVIAPLPTHVQAVLNGTRAANKPNAQYAWLIDPDTDPGRDGTRAARAAERRPADATCSVCGDLFELPDAPRGGRPPTKCETHRFKRVVA